MHIHNNYSCTIAISMSLIFTVSCIFPFYLVVNASLTETTYIVNEKEGFIEVCVVLNRLIQREVVIQVSTTSGSARGII